MMSWRLKIIFIFFCVNACLHVCRRIRLMYGAPESRKRASDLSEVELVIAGSCYVGVENWPWVLGLQQGL